MSIEERLAVLLHELTPEPPRAMAMDQIAARVDQAVKPDRARRQTRWLGSLAAAALVIAIVVAAAALRGPSTHHGPVTQLTPSPTTTSPTPTVTTPIPTPGPALSGTVTLGRARLALPHGWVARTVPGQSRPTWCLAPSTSAPTAALDTCPLWFQQLANPPGPHFSADAQTGYVTFGASCAIEGGTDTLLDYAVRDFGGRAAQYRQWSDVCGTSAVQVTQYLVLTDPAYILYSNHADPTVRAVMTHLAATATLPAQVAPLSYDIMGNVESLSHHADGYHVRLAPWTRQHDGQFVPVPGGTTSSYIIPNSLVPSALTVIGLIELTTNGRQVTALTIVGG